MSRLLILAALGLSAACGFAGADARFDADRVAGRVSVGGLSAALVPGAVIHSDSSSIVLRASSPVTRLALSGIGPLELDLRNIAPGTVLPAALACVSDKSTPLAWHCRFAGTSPIDAVLAPEDAFAMRPFRFAAVGDSQGHDAVFTRVVSAIAADPSLRFIVDSGDLTQSGGAVALERTLAIAEAAGVAYYSTIGNHEMLGGAGFDFQTSVGPATFAFDFSGVRFVMLDTASATLASAAWGFLDANLPAPGAALVVSHVPPFDPDGLRDGGFASRAEGARLAQRLADGRVTLGIFGHVHTLARGSEAGLAYVISGGAGARQDLRSPGYHFLAIDADPLAATLTWTPVIVP